MSKVNHFDPRTDTIDASIDLKNVVHVQKEEDHLVRVYFETDWFIILTDDEIEEICALYLD